MKKILFFASAALAALSFSGCQDFLNVQPEGAPTIDNYFTTDEQAINAMKSVYAPVQYGDDLFGRDLYWEQLSGNAMVCGRAANFSTTLFTLNWTGDESPLTGTYKVLNLAIARTNWIVNSLIDKQAKQKLSEIETRSLGEAYFMRGFLHFTLAYRYGSDKLGVPAIKYENLEGEYDYSIPPQQKTVMDNFQMCKEDLEKAEELLPFFETYGADDRGRPHKAAAVAIMVRLYAFWATFDQTKWDDVITCTNRLETEYKRDLAPSFKSLFSTDFADWWGPEYCWSFPGNGGSAPRCGGVEWTGVIQDKNGWGGYGGWGQFKPSVDIYNMFLEDGKGNERLVTSILEYGQKFPYWGGEMEYYDAGDIKSGFQINKWMQPFEIEDAAEKGYINTNTDYPCTRVNFHVIRFADCLLFRAEAYLHKGEPALAAKDLNRIRRRVHLPENCTGTWKELYHERVCELAFEPASDSFYDLKRWAYSGKEEIKKLAIAAIEKHPDARFHENTSDPHSPYTVAPYPDYQIKKVWADYKICFPYPSQEITNAAGAIKQNPGY